MPLNGTLGMELGAAIGVMMKVIIVVGYLGWHKELLGIFPRRVFT
jgi:hypothetical protein